VPLLALGLGYLAQDLWSRRARWRVLSALVPAAVGVAAAVPLYAGYVDRPEPVIDAAMVRGLKAVRERTPPEAIIWGYWHDGYPIQYWARRASLADGGLHGRDLVVYNSAPFGTADPRLAANFMRFFAARGRDGIQAFYRRIGTPPREGGLALLKSLLAGGPQRLPALAEEHGQILDDTPGSLAAWRAFLFPHPSRPVYLYLNRNLVAVADRWYRRATWDPQAGTGKTGVLRLLTGLTRDGERLRADGGVEVDTVTGVMRLASRAGPVRLPLRRLVEVHGGLQRETEYDPAARFSLRCDLDTGLGLLADPGLADSLFSRLFVGGRGAGVFTPLLLDPPHAQLWGIAGGSGDAGSHGRDVE
jgi:hypothetical protein